MNTKLYGGWAGGSPRRVEGKSRSPKNWKEIGPLLDGVRVAVRGEDLHMINPPMQFTGRKNPWGLRDHLEAIAPKPVMLTVLFEEPGNHEGKGFKRGDFWSPTADEFAAAVNPWLATGQVEYLEFGNELGIVSTNQAVRVQRWKHVAELIESYSNPHSVRLVAGGLHGIERMIETGDMGASFSSYIVSRFPDLANKCALSLHTFAYEVSQLERVTEQMEARGFEVLWTEEFSGTPEGAFFGRREVIELAARMHISLVNVFACFEAVKWGHMRAQPTDLLGVTGPNGNVRTGWKGEPDYLSELRRYRALVGEQDTDSDEPDEDEDRDEPPIADLGVRIREALELSLQATELLVDIVESLPGDDDQDEDEPPIDQDEDERPLLQPAEQRAISALLKDHRGTQLWRFRNNRPERWTVLGPKSTTGPDLGGVNASTAGYGLNVSGALANYEWKMSDDLGEGTLLSLGEQEAMVWYRDMDTRHGPTSIRRDRQGGWHIEFYRDNLGVHHYEVADLPGCINKLREVLGE